MTAVKDQSVVAGYADGLARAGFVTLAFDQRRFGESGGEPRLHEDHEERLSDLHAAVSYLAGLGREMDPNRIGALGVSIGGGLAMKLAAFDPRVKAFVAIGAGLNDPQRIRERFTPDGYANALIDQTAALQRYHRTGELDYVPVVRPPGDDGPVLFPAPSAYEYYGTERGASPLWQNRVTALSLRTLLVHDTLHAADMVGPRAGMLVVGELDVDTPPEDHQAVYDRLNGPRELVIVDRAVHNDVYDVRRYVERVVDRAADWFGAHLKW